MPGISHNVSTCNRLSLSDYKMNLHTYIYIAAGFMIIFEILSFGLDKTISPWTLINKCSSFPFGKGCLYGQLLTTVFPCNVSLIRTHIILIYANLFYLYNLQTDTNQTKYYFH